MLHPKVLVADDHAIVAQGLGSLLQSDFELVGIVNDGRKLVETARQTRPDVIVSDIAMPLLSGLEALRLLRAEQISSKVIFLTMHVDGNLASQALRAGASGYLAKHSAGEELIQAIRQVLEGGVYLTPQIAASIARNVTESAMPTVPRLTPRQREVVRLIADGRTMKQIASELNLSRRTVETHKYEAMEALGVHTTAELIRYALVEETTSGGSVS
ncbi:MAG TPA: response regulator transcription factor [Gemmataceae bacterium]|nr:response regulator transcription factor [Gemmataceae bacterium]